jgi:glyoxylase-like metal-dependent hydrolase (beta-lactamase superfamily II)
MKMRFLGAVSRVTGSCTWLSYDRTGTQILVDCGMVQGEPHDAAENAKPFPFNAKQIKFVLLTHAHLDHCGLLPRLYKDGFSGIVYCTQATAAIARETLLDTARNRLGPFEESDVNKVRFSPMEKHSKFQRFGRPMSIDQDIWIVPLRTAHMLGSVSFTISFKVDDNSYRSITFTGDIGSNSDDACHLPLLRGRQRPYGNIDFIVLESTYGNRRVETGSRSTDARLKAWRDVIDRCHREKDGTIIVAAFAAHRTQEILFDLHLLLREAPSNEDEEFLQVDLDALRTQDFHYGGIKAWIDQTPDREAAAIAPSLFHFDLSKAANVKSLSHFSPDDRSVLEQFRNSGLVPYAQAERALSILEKQMRLVQVRVRLRDDFSLSDCPEAACVLRYLKWLPKRVGLILDSPTARRITACYGTWLDQTDSDGKPLFRNGGIADLLDIDDTEVRPALQALFPTNAEEMITLDLASGWIKFSRRPMPGESHLRKERGAEG